MSFDANPIENDPHGECAHEIHRLQQGLLAAEHLLLAAKGPVGGPTSWTETRKRWLKEFGTTGHQPVGPRILIAGGPLCGKSTVAKSIHDRLQLPVKHCDDLIKTHEWSAASAEVATWIGEPGPWVIEGMAVPRALRKYFAAHPAGKPCDVFLWLFTPHQEPSDGQRTMAKGSLTVLREVMPMLEKAGVTIAQNVLELDKSLKELSA